MITLIKKNYKKKITKAVLNVNSSPKHLWDEGVNMICNLQNKIYIIPLIKRIFFFINCVER